ncbi:MAG: EamA family transporter RarD [Pseudomonadota bacterium]
MNASVRLGFLAAAGAYSIWGLLPLYFKVLGHLAPEEMLAHRIIWSLPTGFILIAIARNWSDLRAAITPARLGWLGISAALIGVNWLTYIWSVSEDRVMEASLGYYMNPLVNVAIGAVFFSERLRAGQWVAFALAAIGVAVITVAYGRPPWIALLLCFSFAAYSIIRKKVQVDGRAGLIVEAAMLAPLAAIWLGWFVQQPDGRIMGEGGWDIPLILLSGPISAFPLIFFAIAAKRLKLSTIGMMQYSAPTLQFLLAVFVFREPFSTTHLIAYAFIWTALIVFTVDSVAGERKARRLARAAEIA